ncbi:RICIN domain-containing protein [Hamadaea tsunoensis]|uniref:RICIN domain-containing protein n=1 Tax=Hamadaea tsunoensis TaxID=53368 RepID=UPI000484F87C|nr:RICIN domain-containing protein [Hamadaea tsunoensis]
MKILRRACAALALCASLAAAGLVNASPAHASLPPYLIHSIDSGGSLCIDVAYASTANGTRIQQWPCYHGAAQSWTLDDQGVYNGVRYYQLVSGLSTPSSPKCIEVPWGNPAAGQALELWDCLGAARQLWSYGQVPGTTYYAFTNMQTKQCIEIPWNTPSAGSPVQQWPCYPGEAQEWYFTLY